MTHSVNISSAEMNWIEKKEIVTYDKNPQMNGNPEASPVLFFWMYLWHTNLHVRNSKGDNC